MMQDIVEDFRVILGEAMTEDLSDLIGEGVAETYITLGGTPGSELLQMCLQDPAAKRSLESLLEEAVSAASKQLRALSDEDDEGDEYGNDADARLYRLLGKPRV